MGAPAVSERPVPLRIGPYRVVSRLASGGMADIYLARRNGSVGVEPPVVIKRTLPHLLDEPDLRSALLDEARVMARLRHPNVVAVHELGSDEHSLYLVMEYLRGESLSGLARALRQRGERMKPALAAFIAMEICGGLHAAHELRDDEGRPLHLVHRDVSPQNVFVTFHGEVKLLDFGIARFEDRTVQRTRTGITKGKFAYMAPEQFAGTEVDRRADIFAVGVLLHDLLTGHRLFARETEMQVLRAILDDAIPPPSLRAPDVPGALDAICMQALSRDPAERFATASQLRAALRELMPQLDPRQDARERLVALARAVLPERVVETRELIARAADSSGARRTGEILLSSAEHAMAPAEKAPARERESLLPTESLSARIDRASSPDAITQAAKPPRSRTTRAGRALRYVGLGALLLAGGFGVGHALSPTETIVVHQPTPVPTEPIVIAAPLVLPPPPRDMVSVTFQTIPEGASVSREGVTVCTSPCALVLPRSSEPIELAVARAGYRVMSASVVPLGDHAVRLELTPERVRPSARSRAARQRARARRRR